MVPMLVFRSGLPSLSTGFLWSWWPSVDGLCLRPALSVTFRVLFSVFLSLGFATLFQLPVGSAPEICFPVSQLSWYLLVLPPGLLDISGDWLCLPLVLLFRGWSLAVAFRNYVLWSYGFIF